MVCRTPDPDEIQDSSTGSAPQFLRLVTAGEESLNAQMPAVSRKRCSVRSRRAAVRRKQARRLENAVFTAVAAVVLLATLFGGARAMMPQPAHAYSVASVTVAPGDTLWTLAQRYTPAGQPTASTVDSIRAANPGLSEGQALHVGQRILVPVASSAMAQDASMQMASAR